MPKYPHVIFIASFCIMQITLKYQCFVAKNRKKEDIMPSFKMVDDTRLELHNMPFLY